ncbi:MAG: hypothetical protein V7L27_28875 [Nostoc sp.]|uniref:hypothetical protein n=1 Tax=Nostoc sp. TaxID=1180 RepID=UPI002FFCE66B
MQQSIGLTIQTDVLIRTSVNTVRLRQETPIYRVFEIYNFHQKTLTERYWH